MLKARITKCNNKKLLKRLGFSLNKPYSLQKFDYLLNLIVEELHDFKYKKHNDEVIVLDMDLIESDTKNQRWYDDNVEINSFLGHIPSDEFEEKSSPDNSLLKKIISRNLNQDPEVTSKDKEELYDYFEESYFDEESKDSHIPIQIIKKVSNIFSKPNKNDGENEDIKKKSQISNEKVSVENQLNEKEESVSKKQSQKTEEAPKIDEAPSFDNYDPFNLENDEDNKVEENEDSSEVKSNPKTNNKDKHLDIINESNHMLPISLPIFNQSEITRLTSSDRLTQLKYDTLFNRMLERETFKLKQYEELETKIQNKYRELTKEAEIRINQYKKTLELEDEVLYEVENEKQQELEERLNQYISEQKSEIEIQLAEYKKELDLKLENRKFELDNASNKRINELKESHQKELEEHLVDYIEAHDQSVEYDVLNKQKEEQQIIKETLLNKLENYEATMQENLDEFDNESYDILRQEIHVLKHQVIYEQELEAEKMRLETEKLKAKADIDNKNQQIRELESNKALAKAEEAKLAIIQEENRKLELEVIREKQIYEEKLLSETERKNKIAEEDLRLREKELANLKSKDYAIINPSVSQSQTDKQQNNKIKNNESNIKFLAGAGLIAVVLGGGYAYAQTTHKEEQPKKPVYSELIESRSYNKALKEYPNKEKDIAKKAYQNKDVEGVNAVLKVDDNAMNKMYKALLDNNEQDIVSIYKNNHKQLDLTNTQLEAVGKALVSQNYLKEAKELNKSLKSSGLKESINDKALLEKTKKEQAQQQVQQPSQYQYNQNTNNGE